jgi:ABC-type Mn2+/Zn2+ transport system permease subunit
MTPGEIFSTLLHEFPFALWGSVLVGVVCAYVGVSIVARRVVFLGAVMTQVSVLGLAITFLPFVAIPHTVGSVVITLASVMILSRLLTGKRVPRDAVLGVVFVSSIAARILIMQKTPRVEVAEIENLLRGDILFVTPELFWLMLAASLAALLLQLLFSKELRYAAFDPETAATQGYRTGVWDMVFYLGAGLVIAFATHMVGDIFVFGFLVIPPVTALLLARTVRGVILVSVAIGALAPLVGLYLAFRFDVPSSPAIVAVAWIVLGVIWVGGVVRRMIAGRT